MIDLNYSINKQMLDSVLCLKNLWMTSPRKQCRMADVDGHASFSASTMPIQDLGPWGWKIVRTARNDVGTHEWQCRKPYIYISSSFLPSLNPKLSYSTKIKSLEGVINLVPGSQDFPISLSCFTPTGFLSVFFFFKHSWDCKLVSVLGPLFLFPSTWNSLPLSFMGLISLRYSVLRFQVTSKEKPSLTTQSQAVCFVLFII